VVKGKGRPKGSKNNGPRAKKGEGVTNMYQTFKIHSNYSTNLTTIGTRRDLSLFEITSIALVVLGAVPIA
jgi:hypothetical protein